MTKLERSFAGCLLGLTIGDRLGVRLEGLSLAPLQHRYATRESLLALELGDYTAATEMTMATAESLVACRGFDGADLAGRLARADLDGRSYGQGTRAAIEAIRKGVAWNEAALGPAGRSSFGNGAALRSAPIAMLQSRDADELRWLAEEAASVTHQHALGAEGAVIQAFAVATALRSEGRAISSRGFLESLAREAQVREFGMRLVVASQMLEHKRVDASVIVARLGNNSSALGSVVTAAFCFARHPDSFTDAVLLAVSLGGNASAIGSMAGAISGAYLGADALPEGWCAALDGGDAGAAKLEAMALEMSTLVT